MTSVERRTNATRKEYESLDSGISCAQRHTLWRLVSSSKSDIRPTIAAFAAMGAAAGAAPAFADVTGEALSVMNFTIESVCEPFSGRDLADVQRYKVCFTTAMSHAVMNTERYARS
jgi:hypothetical protein